MLSLTRRDPAILRVASGESKEILSVVLVDAGLSASRSRLFEGDGLEVGRGRSPTNASSKSISLQRPL